MPRVKPEHKNERRAQIVDAARICFARNGFHRTTLQDVFAQAKLSAGCVYNYFHSKDDLILAIAEERHRHERTIMAQGSRQQDPLAGLRRIVSDFVQDYLTAQGVTRRRIAIQTWSEAMLNPDILASVREGFDAPQQEIAALIKRGKKLGQIADDADPEAVARTMIALFHGFMLQKLWDETFDVGGCLTTFERFLSTLKKP